MMNQEEGLKNIILFFLWIACTYSTCNMNCENCAFPWTTIHLLWARVLGFVKFSQRSETKTRLSLRPRFVSFSFASTLTTKFSNLKRMTARKTTFSEI